MNKITKIVAFICQIEINNKNEGLMKNNAE